MKKTLAHFAPFAFCAFLSGIWFVGSAFLGAGSSAWQPAFFCFLPMCFFFVAANTMQMRKELEELRQKVTDMERGTPANQFQKP